MKLYLLNEAGKWLMSHGGLRIVIADDEAAYFSEPMIETAKKVGFRNIQRIFRVDVATLQNLLRRPPHIIILDIRGVTDRDVAKDGLGLASLMRKNSSCYVVITSSHRFHLSNHVTQADYVMENRLLSIVDFIDELRKITDDYLGRRNRFYRLLVFRCGWAMAKAALSRTA